MTVALQMRKRRGAGALLGMSNKERLVKKRAVKKDTSFAVNRNSFLGGVSQRLSKEDN